MCHDPDTICIIGVGLNCKEYQDRKTPKQSWYFFRETIILLNMKSKLINTDAKLLFIPETAK